MPYLTWRKAASTVLCASALTAGSLAAATAAQAASQRIPVANTHPSWATAAHRVGASQLSSGTVSSRVYLAPNDAAGLASLATEVSTPGSALYRHFLTPQQIQARFGTTTAQLDAVKNWLTQSGLRVTGVSNHVAGGYVAVSGSLAAASRAFSVSFASYRDAGQTVRAPEQAASVPATVASSVLSVSGLSTAKATMKPLSAKLPKPGPNYWVAKPCSAYWGQSIAKTKPSAYGKKWSYAVCGYTPKQVRAAYGVTASGMTGAGQTVAVVDAYASPTMLRDANQFSKLEGEQQFGAGQYKQYLPASGFTQAGNSECGAQGWYGEETLDVESVHDMAPAANVRFVAAASCQDYDLADALSYIVNNKLADIVSNSWGDTEAGAAEFVNTYHLIFETGAAEGIDFTFSSGDDGYEAPGEDPGYSTHVQVDYPTSDPYVTSVGGTSLAIGKTNNYEFETAWGTLLDPLSKNGKSWKQTPPGGYPYWFDGASGGGVSTQFAEPWYQKASGIVPTSLAESKPGGGTFSSPMRVIPDVSAYADPATGMLVGETVLKPSGHGYEFALSRIGGTSVACPTFAGIEADAQQAAGGPLGFANPAIYALAASSDSGAFHDVTSPASYIAQVRVNYVNPDSPSGAKVDYLRTLGIDGEGAAALKATPGFDDATGVGTPAGYILAVRGL